MAHNIGTSGSDRRNPNNHPNRPTQPRIRNPAAGTPVHRVRQDQEESDSDETSGSIGSTGGSEPSEILAVPLNMARVTGNRQGYGMKRIATDFGGIKLADDVPIYRERGTTAQEERQAKNTREASKALRDRLKDES